MSKYNENDTDVTVSKGTKVRLELVIGIVVATLGISAMFFDQKMFNYRQEQFNTKFMEMMKSQSENTDRQFADIKRLLISKVSIMQINRREHELQRLNPSLNLPPPIPPPYDDSIPVGFLIPIDVTTGRI